MTLFTPLKTKSKLSTVKSILISLIILTHSLTALYAQTGKSDTLTCYSNEELQKIASRVVRASECDTLLSIAEQQLLISAEVNRKLENIIELKDIIIVSKDSIITDHVAIIDIKTEMYETEKRKHKWTKAGWLSSTIGLLAVISALIF